MHYLYALAVAASIPVIAAVESINRKAVVTQFNPERVASSNSTPVQVGNGNFAFGADVTGLQTFQPFNTLSSWGWHNVSLPTTLGQTSPSDFTGLDWWMNWHHRLVNYDQPNPAENDISNWLIENPHRINLGQVGLWFGGKNITESDLTSTHQVLDLYTGQVTSSFEYDGAKVQVQTYADPASSTVAIQVKSNLLEAGKLGLFFDYPYANGLSKFEAPYVGIWNATANHTTSLQQHGNQAVVQHDMDSLTYFNAISWEGKASIYRVSNESHQYVLQPKSANTFTLTVQYSPTVIETTKSYSAIEQASTSWWDNFWETGAFIDLTGSKSANATELQRRIILSQYLLAVNEAGKDSPQESGLTNNGWYGKFHLEMTVWHLCHWARWGKWSLLDRSLGMYNRFLPTSLQRAQEQGYLGARWGKMSDPSGRSAPGEINSLLIWQQPHVFFFAETEYRSFPTPETLDRWDNLLTVSADFMASFAFWNTSTKAYDLGPAMYPVPENTAPNSTTNPTFELAYWQFGLKVASEWKQRQKLPVPAAWTHVMNNLAPLPIQNGTYVVYEGIPDMWIQPTTYQDHPSLIGIYGLLPPPPSLKLNVMKATAQKIWQIWDLPEMYGWDFAMLAMNAARLGDTDQAIDFLLHPDYPFDDYGYPGGGERVPTPYFPNSGGLLMAVAMFAGGWDGSEGGHWPEGWLVKAEGFVPVM